ncbi:DUF6168 family protein [Jejudonia soesokkakensis]|uniref:DUF6168 family protein n=1 Tax=Jejudonia soesokkakensis TaxID=1323432 RepID=A0ABW2MRJ1_9FLAO
MKKGIVFSLYLALILSVVFGMHLGVNFFAEIDLFSNKILLSYSVNFVLAILLLIVLQYSVNKKSTNTGFLFMAGSAVKFVVFFLVFYPSFTVDDTMQLAEFAAFFVPYAVCLILEVAYLSKQLNNQSYSSKNPSD